MVYEPGTLLRFSWHGDTFGICKVIRITDTLPEPIVSITTYSNFFDRIPEAIEPAALRPMVTHMPMLLSSLAECMPVGKTDIRQRELAAYQRWLKAYQAGRSGYFSRPVSESVSQVLEAMLDD